MVNFIYISLDKKLILAKITTSHLKIEDLDLSVIRNPNHTQTLSKLTPTGATLNQINGTSTPIKTGHSRKNK